jgi:hypothetical protein
LGHILDNEMRASRGQMQTVPWETDEKTPKQHLRFEQMLSDLPALFMVFAGYCRNAIAGSVRLGGRPTTQNHGVAL